MSGREAVVLGLGNLGLIYLMGEPRRLTLEEIDERHQADSSCARTHIGWLQGARRGAAACARPGRNARARERRGRG